MIIKCPNCSFEQPRESAYCPSCGGNLEALLKADKQKKKKEGLKAKLIIAGLFSALIVGYVLIFYLGGNSDKIAQTDQALQESSRNRKLRLKSSKIISRAAAPKRVAEPTKKFKKPSKMAALVEQKGETDSKEVVVTDDTAAENQDTQAPDKKIQKISILDRFNCEEPSVEINLDTNSTEDLLSCGSFVIEDLNLDDEILLEDGETPLSIRVNLQEDSISVSVVVLVEDKPISYEYFFSLPKITEETASLAFPLKLKQPSESFSDSFENSEMLPLFFKDKNKEISEDTVKWSPLILHATF